MLGGIYGRVSTYVQRDQNTIKTQKRANYRYAKYAEIRIYKEYYDDGVSSSYPLHKRPGGSELLRDARAKKFDCVIVYKLDRLGRSAVEILQVVDFLNKIGIKLISVTENIDSSTPMGKAMLGMCAVFAELEKNTIRERTIEGSRRLASEGKNPNGHPAYGYKIVDGYWVIVKEAARIVKLVFKYCRDGLSAEKIADKLNKICPAPKGGKWRPATVNYMLNNKDYYGLYVYGKNRNINVEGKVRTVPAPKANQINIKIPAIVSRKVWDAAQKQRQNNAKHSKRNSKRFYLLSSLVKCANCGLGYNGHTTLYNGKEFIYYSCSSSSRKVKCGMLSIRAEYLEPYVWNEITSFIKNPKSVTEKLMARLANTDGLRSEIQRELSVLDRQLKKKMSFKEELVRAIGRKLLTDEDAKPQIKEAKQLIAGLEEAKESLLKQQGDILLHKDSLNQVESVLRLLSDRVDKADNDTKAKIAQKLVEKIVIEPNPMDPRKPPRAVVHYFFNYNQNARPL